MHIPRHRRTNCSADRLPVCAVLPPGALFPHHHTPILSGLAAALRPSDRGRQWTPPTGRAPVLKRTSAARQPPRRHSASTPTAVCMPSARSRMHWLRARGASRGTRLGVVSAVRGALALHPSLRPALGPHPPTRVPPGSGHVTRTDGEVCRGGTRGVGAPGAAWGTAQNSTWHQPGAPVSVSARTLNAHRGGPVATRIAVRGRGRHGGHAQGRVAGAKAGEGVAARGRTPVSAEPHPSSIISDAPHTRSAHYL